MSIHEVKRTALVTYTPEQMFDLVVDVERYCEFLPWVKGAQVHERSERELRASITMERAGVRQTFTTRNLHLPGREVRMKLVDGPFSLLDGRWTFHPLGKQAAERACKVALELHYSFKNPALAALVGPVFDKIAGNLVDAFVKRAEQVYGT